MPASPSPAPADDAYLDPHIETMPPETLARLQEQRVLGLIGKAYERAPLIRTAWDAAGVHPSQIRSLADYFAKAPFIDKDAIRRHRDAHLDPVGGLQICDDGVLDRIGFTSGTTGDPTAVPQGRVSPLDMQLCRDFWQIGARPGDFMAEMMFTFRGGQTSLACFDKIGLTPIGMAHSPAEIPFLVEISKQFRPTLLFMLSSPMIIGLEKYFEETGTAPRDVFASYKGAVFGGEPLSPRFKALVASWGMELFEFTTCGDVIGAMECHMHDGMHAWGDLVLIENLDDNNNPVPDGEIGELVVTALAAPWAPLIRFRTEDLVRVERSRCGCGRTHPRFWPLGRKGDETLVQGKSVLPRDIQRIVEQHAETRTCLFQIIRPQREMEILRLRIGYDSTKLASTAEELSSRLIAVLAEGLSVPVHVELVLYEELLKLGPPQKIPRVTKQ